MLRGVTYRLLTLRLSNMQKNDCNEHPGKMFDCEKSTNVRALHRRAPTLLLDKFVPF